MGAEEEETRLRQDIYGDFHARLSPWIFYESAVRVYGSWFILFLFDLQKKKVVLEQCPENSVHAYPGGLLYRDPACLTGAGKNAQPCVSSHTAFISSKNI